MGFEIETSCEKSLSGRHAFMWVPTKDGEDFRCVECFFVKISRPLLDFDPENLPDANDLA